MKNLFALPTPVILCFMLAGCPYNSPYPLSVGPVQKVDSTLLGAWYKYGFADDSVFNTVVIKAKSPTEYSVMLAMPGVKNDLMFDTVMFYATGTLIAGQTVFTCSDTSAHPDEYFYAVAYHFERNRMSILLLPDVMVGAKPIHSSEELKQIVTRYLTQNASKIGYDNDAWLNNLTRR